MGAGRKGKYAEWITDEGLIKIEGWARDGLTNAQIAHNIGVNPDTLYTWMKRFPEIADTLKKGKEVIDRHVENALLKRALGYRYEEVTQEIVAESGEIEVTKIVTKEVQPDTTAQIFWLKNRKPNEWREKPDKVYIEKAKMEIEYLKKKVEAIEGGKVDYGLLETLKESLDNV